TTASYSIPTTQSGHAGTYRCVVTNPAGSVASNGAVLTVITPPSITSQPANVVLVGSNTTATFSVTVTPGYGTTLSYRWQKNGVDIGGATSATYTITDANSTHVGTYTCVVTNAGGAIVTSSTATLSFFSGTVIESFGNTSLLYNSQGYYLGGLSTPLTYGGTHLSPNSFLNYTVLAVEKVGGEYRALWKTPNGYWIERVGLNGSHKSFGPTFGVAQLRDQEETFKQDFNNDGVIGVMPVITGQPEHALGVTGGAVHTLKVVALDGSSYQWQKNGVDISGATSATYSISGFGLDDEGVYRCVISSSAGSVKSGQVYRFLKLAAGAVTTSSEDFSSVDRNATRWGTQDFLWGAGRLIQSGTNLLYYTQGVPANNNDATRGWHVQALPYSQDWAVQVDVNLPALSMGTNSALTLNLGIVSSDDPKNHASMALERRREDANATMHFFGHMGLSDKTVLDANGSTTSTNATVRLRWDAAAQTLYYEYDANGSAALRDPASPHYTDFSGFASKVLNAGDSDWKMNASSSFLVSLGGFSHGLNIAQSDGVSFDNFKIAALPKITTHPLPQTVGLDGNATF
ncbi:uncharacterized protein METZ01_LOCUS198568, partial [marine metagenome]